MNGELLVIDAGREHVYVRNSLVDLLAPYFEQRNIAARQIMLSVVIVVPCGESAVRLYMVVDLETEIGIWTYFPLDAENAVNAMYHAWICSGVSPLQGGALVTNI